MAARGTFLQTCLLLLVGEEPNHGYELVRRLTEFGFCDSDPGRIYRSLRHLEQEGLLASDWRTAGPGPARRTYRLTADGDDTLARRMASLRDLRADIDVVLAHQDRVHARSERSDTVDLRTAVPKKRLSADDLLAVD